MLSRRREQILIICGLIGLNILLGWSLSRLWKDYRGRTQWVYVASPARSAATLTAGSKQSGQAQDLGEIVTRNMFSPLRGSQPPQSQEEAMAPKLPVLFGTMDLGNGRFALMASGDEPSAASKRVLPGDDIGGYKLVSIGTSNVVVAWQEKKVTLDISESVRHVPGVVEKTAGPSPRTAPVTTVGGTANSGPGAAPASANASASAGQSARAANRDVPDGTVVGGKRKVTVQTPFGAVVQWQDVDQSASRGSQQSGGPNK